MNTPNKLTMLRVILVPFFVFFVMATGTPHNNLIALILFAIASITDYLDGSIARKNGLVTDFGKFADPLADKILVMSALICFSALGLISVWQVLVILFREFAVTSVRLVAAGGGKVIAANNLGKIKTVSQIIAIIIIFVLAYSQNIAEVYFPEFWLSNSNISDIIIVLNELFMGVATFFSILSGYVYIKENWDCIKQAK